MEGDPAMRPSGGDLPSQSFHWINNFTRPPPPPWGNLAFVIVTGEQALIDWTESSGCGTISPEKAAGGGNQRLYSFLYLFIYFISFLMPTRCNHASVSRGRNEAARWHLISSFLLRIVAAAAEVVATGRDGGRRRRRREGLDRK